MAGAKVAGPGYMQAPPPSPREFVGRGKHERCDMYLFCALKGRAHVGRDPGGGDALGRGSELSRARASPAPRPF